MPGMWTRRDPVTGQIWQQLTRDEMSALLRKSNPRSPEYVQHLPDGATRMTMIDKHAIGVELVGAGLEESIFRWEFDLYEDWWESDHSAPAPSIVAGAKWMGCSLVDYLCAPGSAVAYAQQMIAAERATALDAAEPMLSALRAMNIAGRGLTCFLTEKYATRHGVLHTLLLDVLGDLCGNNAECAAELLDVMIDDDHSIAYMLGHWEKHWHNEDHPHRATPPA